VVVSVVVAAVTVVVAAVTVVLTTAIGTEIALEMTSKPG
jgi:hypothetical protein